MSARLAGLAVVVVVVLVAADARAVDLTGDLNGLYSHAGSWSAYQSYRGRQVWDYGGRLTLRATPFKKTLLDWLGTAEYQRRRDLYSGGESGLRAVGFQSRASLFQGSRAPITLGAMRTWSDFLSDTAGSRTGSTVTTSYGGSARLQPKGLPALLVAMSRVITEGRRFGAPEVDTDSTTLNLGMAQAVGGHNYMMEYQTSWDSGSWAELNYRSHTFLLSYNGQVTDTTTFRVSERYMLRLPTVEDPTNPRWDSNDFTTGVTWVPDSRVISGFGYGYSHALATVVGAPDLEQIIHSVSHRTAYRWTEGLWTEGSLDLVYGFARSGAEERRSAGEVLGATVKWVGKGRETQYMLDAGGLVSLSVPEDGDLVVGFGANGLAGFVTTRERIQSRATWAGAYRRSGADLDGDLLSQRLDLSASGRVSERSVLRGGISVATGRRMDRLLGTATHRGATATAALFGARFRVQLEAGVTDGIAPVLGDGEALFLPDEFNTHTYYATLTGGRTYLGGRMVLSGVLRTMRTTAPARDAMWEEGLLLMASYTIGLTTFSLEERLSAGGLGGGWQVGNLVFLRVGRSFGTRF